nr:PREDICTED: E3 ubiquitin-protein ligase MBR2-like [Nicotiana tabacum]
MQGKRSSIGSFSETLDFGSTSTSGDGIDQQMCWNSRVPDYVVSPNQNNISFLNPVSHERQNIMGWGFGEPSSTNHAGQSERKTDHGWSSTMNACPEPSHFSDEHQYGSPNILSLSNVEVNLNSVQMANSSIFSQGSSPTTLPHDMNTNSGFEGHHGDDDSEDDCQIMECTPAYKSDLPGKEWMSSATTCHTFAGPFGTNGFLIDENDGRPGSSLDGRRLSCKRKALEGHLGQSSASGSRNYIPHAENSLWHSLPSPHSMGTGASICAPTEGSGSINLSEQLNPRLGLSMGGTISESPLRLPASGIAESSRNTFRLRVNSSHQQDTIPSNLFPAVGDAGNVNVSSDWHSSRVFHNNSLNLMSMSAADNVNPQSQASVVHVPSLHRSSQARWDLAPNSRTSSSSSFYASGERDSAPYQEPHSRSLSRNISHHPMFIPVTDARNLNQNPANWSLAGGGNISIVGNVASTSRSSSSSRSHLSSPSRVQHRNPPQYSRRLSEYVRRSLLSSADAEPGGRSGNSPSLCLSAASRVLELSGNHGHRQSRSRSTALSERHLDGGIGVSHSWRTLAAASEGRSRLVSEIRNVLDLMRRGEGLQLEDVMILDQSVFFGMADIHDRHRDMRVDVDNMSYEELLALEERIGNVCTGLGEEAILSHLKQRSYICVKSEEPIDAEPCCICQEEYNDGEDLGTLECGHDFHRDCIKQWLKHKNICPICKTTGLNT